MDKNTNGVQQYYQTIRNRLVNYIKSDYLANSETLLLYADDILGEKCTDDINMLNWKIDFQFAKVNTCSWKSLQEQIPVY